MLFILVAVILCTVILFVNIRFGIEYKKNDQNDRLAVRISVIRNILKLEIPLIDTEKKRGKWGFSFRKKDKKPNSFISFEKMKEASEKAYDTFHKYLGILVALKKYMKKKIACETFVFKLNYGLGDAALTGISTGMLWGLIYAVLGAVDTYIDFKEIDTSIHPDFNDVKLQMYFNCIFKIKIVHIIIVIFIVLYTFIKDVLLRKVSSQNFIAG